MRRPRSDNMEMDKSVENFRFWSQIFENEYHSVDRNRSYSEMWLLTVEHAAKISEAIRERKYENACDNLAEVFCWICGFVTKCNLEKKAGSLFRMNESLEEMIWLKYHRKCPLCKQNPCFCPVWKTQLNKLAKEEKDMKYDIIEREGRRQIERQENIGSIDWMVEMFDELYRNSYTISNVEEVCFHFNEEIGEVAEIVRKLDRLEHDSSPRLDDERIEIENLQKQLKWEIADVFSWTAALIIKFNIMMEELSPILNYFKVNNSEDEVEAITPIQPIKYTDILRKVFYHLILDNTSQHSQSEIFNE
jgi:NTP pyrophosphatase (non-canonical NTP hydrolase)